MPAAIDIGTDEVFTHGVASFDPAADRVILWTRVATDAGALTWHLAERGADGGPTGPVRSEVVTREPGDATGRYNLACVLALAGDRESAFNELRIALQKEPSLIAHAKQDEDLKSLRDSPEWTELFQSLESSVPQRSAR